jgi:hypothetical protein
MLIRSHGYVHAVHGPPFLLQHGIEILVLPLAFQPHALTKMPFAAQTKQGVSLFPIDASKVRLTLFAQGVKLFVNRHG